MDTFVQFIQFETGEPSLVRVGAINQIQARDAHSSYILMQDEDGLIVNGNLVDVLGRINDAMMITAGAEASMSIGAWGKH